MHTIHLEVGNKQMLCEALVMQVSSTIKLTKMASDVTCKKCLAKMPHQDK